MTRLIIDTDPGVDDAIAIAIAALDPGTDLLGVTTVFGNVGLDKTTGNALRLLELCGRDDVPVAAGAAMPLVHPQARRDSTAHGDDGLSGHADVLPETSREPVAGSAVGLMATLLEQSEEPVTIAPIGPLTNIAALLAAYPHLKSKIGRLVIMGGALEGGNVSARAEFNIWSDPEAARRVLVAEDVPSVLVPLDLTYRCAVDTEWMERLAASGRVGEALAALTPDYVRHYTGALGWPCMVVHDAVAIVEAITPGALVTESLPLDVECSFGPSRGAVIADRRRQAQIDDTVPLDVRGRVDVAVDTDVDRLRALLLDGIAGRMEA